MSLILGISAYYHDSAATLMKDGHVVCAFQEERFSRIKQDKRFPRNAIKACFDYFGTSLIHVGSICYYENPELKYDRVITTFRHNFPKGVLLFLCEFLRYRSQRKIVNILRKELESIFGACDAEISYAEHHQSHAASVYYPSPFASSAVLCVDGVGEWSTVSAWVGKGTRLEPLWHINFPDSLGL